MIRIERNSIVNTFVAKLCSTWSNKSEITITAKEISNPMILRNHRMNIENKNLDTMNFDKVVPLKEIEKEFRTKYIKYVKGISSSDSSAAEKLGLAPSNFYRMCKELGLK